MLSIFTYDMNIRLEENFKSIPSPIILSPISYFFIFKRTKFYKIQIIGKDCFYVIRMSSARTRVKTKHIDIAMIALFIVSSKYQIKLWCPFEHALPYPYNVFRIPCSSTSSNRLIINVAVILHSLMRFGNDVMDMYCYCVAKKNQKKTSYLISVIIFLHYFVFVFTWRYQDFFKCILTFSVEICATGRYKQ